MKRIIHILEEWHGPDDYKVDTMIITKFEKDMKSEMSYKFINAFPKSITPISVSYGGD